MHTDCRLLSLVVTRKSSVGGSQVRETCQASWYTLMLFIGGKVAFIPTIMAIRRLHIVLRIQAVSRDYADAREQTDFLVLAASRFLL